MLVKISLIVALCSGLSYNQVNQKVEELVKLYPGAKVSVRVDEKASCVNGRILTGSEAKLMKLFNKQS